MITRLEYLAHAQVFLSREVARLRPMLQVFFVRLIFTTDGAGRFLADAAELRAGLYAHELQQVSERDVASRLQELHRAGLVKLYTEAGVGYGKVTEKLWRQRDKLRKVIHPDEAAEPPEPGLFADPGIELNGREGEGCAPKARPGHPPPPMPSAFSKPPATKPSPVAESDAAWLERLEHTWPGVDVAAELLKAHRRHPAGLERGFFEKSWLPNVTPKAPRPGVSSGARPPVLAGVPDEVWRHAAKVVAHETQDAELRERRLEAVHSGAAWQSFGPEFQAQIQAQIRRARGIAAA